MTRVRSLSPIASALLVAALATPAYAGTITLFDSTTCVSTSCMFSASSGPLSAEATFDYDSITSVLTVSFTNTGAPSTGAADVMTALFWEMPGSPTLTGLYGAAGLGSDTMLTTPNGDLSLVSTPNQLFSLPTSSFGTPYIGGEWDYKGNVASPIVGDYGLASTGIKLGFGGDPFPDFAPPADCGDPSIFPNCSITGSPSVNGPDYSLANGIGAFGGNEHTLLIVPNGPSGSSTLQFQFDLNSAYAGVANVAFHFGTDSPIPEPGSNLLFASGALVIGAALRRRSLALG